MSGSTLITMANSRFNLAQRLRCIFSVRSHASIARLSVHISFLSCAPLNIPMMLPRSSETP